MVEYDVGARTLSITHLSELWKPASEGPSAALEVADFDEAIATLRAANIRLVIEPRRSSSCSLAVVCDPDGNAIAIHKRNAR